MSDFGDAHATLEDIEEWSLDGLLGVDVQLYDLTQVTEFVSEMADASCSADAPLFSKGYLPAKRCVFLMRGFREDTGAFVPLYAEQSGPNGVLFSMLAFRAHNEVMRELLDTTKRIREEIALNPVSFPADIQQGVDWLDSHGWLDPERAENRIREDHTAEIGKPANPDYSEVSKMFSHIASACCEFMCMPIATSTPSSLPRPMRRRLERVGRVVRITSVNVTRSVAAGFARSGGHGDAGGRALHFVSGHWRISPTSIHAQLVHGQMKIWIDGFWRGDPEHGVVLHRYLARNRSAA